MRPAYWQLHLPGGHRTRGGNPRNPVVLGRKFCTVCGHWRQLCDFGHRAKEGRAREACYACVRIAQRAARQQRTPEQRALAREYYRIWADAKRRAAGVPARHYRRPRKSVVDRLEYRFLDCAPLVAALNDYLAQEEVTMPGDLGHGVEGLASLAQVPARSITRLLTGQSQRVRLDLADKLCSAIDMPLALVYGDMPLVNLHQTVAA